MALANSGEFINYSETGRKDAQKQNDTDRNVSLIV